MKYKNTALAVLFTASLAVAVQDFGVPPGIPNVFSAGEVAVADDVNANFDWVEARLDDLSLADGDLDDLINANEDASKQRTQSLAALGYFHSGPAPISGANGESGFKGKGGPTAEWLGWLNIPVPHDWDASTEMTVTVNMLNQVNPGDGQSAQDIEVDIYGDLISEGQPSFNSDPFCSPGPDCEFDFSSNCFISVPAVRPTGPPLFQRSIGFPDTDYLVAATFTIEANAFDAQGARQIKINFYEPSNPLVGGQKGGGGAGSDPIITLNDQSGVPEPTPFTLPSFVTLEYTAL